MKAIFRILLIAVLASAGPLYAESENTIEGMVVKKEDGRTEVHKDIRSRMPTLTTRVEHNSDSDSVTIFANAFVESKDSNLYPIVVKFYVNGRLFSDQITTTQHPRPVGITVGSDVATIPFDYTVIAKVQHPNRTIPSVIEGTVFASSFNSTLDCTLTLTVDDEADDYTADLVDTIQTGNNSFDIMFDTINSEGDQVSVTGTVTVAEDGSATSLLELGSSSSSTQVMTTGTATVEDGDLVDFDLESETGATALSCF